MPPRDKQIGERTDHKQAMSVLFEPAVAHLGEPKHSLDDADGMLDKRESQIARNPALQLPFPAESVTSPTVFC
jgi:hypothetical protein